MSMSDEFHKALFSYGQMRASCIDTAFSSRGMLEIEHFVRQEYLGGLCNALISNRDIFSQSPNTSLQGRLSPVSRQCLWELHSGIMIRLLENITGMVNLLPDTHCEYSGLNISSFYEQQPAFTHGKPGPTLLLLIYLSSGNATLKKFPTEYPDHNDSAGIFYTSYWQHPVSCGEASP